MLRGQYPIITPCPVISFFMRWNLHPFLWLGSYSPISLKWFWRNFHTGPLPCCWVWLIFALEIFMWDYSPIHGAWWYSSCPQLFSLAYIYLVALGVKCFRTFYRGLTHSLRFTRIPCLSQHLVRTQYIYHSIPWPISIKTSENKSNQNSAILG